MNESLFSQVKTKEKLLIIVDKDDTIIWEAASSPASSLFKAYFKGELTQAEDWTVYANQAGMAIAIIAPKLNIKHCYACRMSECGKERFEKNGVEVEYEELIPLVKSSADESKVCPIERFLYVHSGEEEQWEYLKERFADE